MRKYNKFVRPRGDLKLIRDALHKYWSRYGMYEKPFSWRQYPLWELFDDAGLYRRVQERWVSAISSVVGIDFNPKEFSLVLHIGKEGVAGHSDSLAKTSFLVPLQASPTIRFFEEFESVALSQARLIRFNDHNYHGIQNPNCGIFQVLSISKDVRLC
jgi:hypothetical protein